MSVLLHPGADLVSYEQLRAVPTPPRTATHVPLAHHELVDMALYALGYYGHEVAEEHHAVTEDGMRYFGLLSLRSTYGDYTDTVGLRNSHDQRFSIGIAFGSRVFVCSNLAFAGERIIRRKHTPRAKRDLPGLIAEVIEPLKEQREAQFRVFERYKATELSPTLADHAIMELYRREVINVQRIADVVRQWDEPDFDWGPPTAYRLFNACTHSLNGRVAENPSATRELHAVIDAVCEAA